MRKIKFRAYDKERKEYLSAGQIFLSINSGESPVDSVQYLDLLNNPNMYADRFEIEQFTGMLDKNRKEIYEGDIVRFYVDVEDDIVNAPVLFHNDSCSFCVQLPWFGDLIGLYAHWQFEVVGDIHHSPELLKGGAE